MFFSNKVEKPLQKLFPGRYGTGCFIVKLSETVIWERGKVIGEKLSVRAMVCHSFKLLVLFVHRYNWNFKFTIVKLYYSVKRTIGAIWIFSS